KHRAGILSMARGEEIDSALTSFFIVLADQPPLDGTYTVFGRVIEGMDVVEKIAAVPQENERPKERVDIYAMKVERKKSSRSFSRSGTADVVPAVRSCSTE